MADKPCAEAEAKMEKAKKAVSDFQDRYLKPNPVLNDSEPALPQGFRIELLSGDEAAQLEYKRLCDERDIAEREYKDCSGEA